MIISGGLNVLKPPGMTSHDVVSVIRRIFHEKSVGHAGTLDPAAAGVLPICIGEATKVIQFIQDGTKDYRAELILGIETDSEDYTGTVISEAQEDFSVDWSSIVRISKLFLGKISQIPPMVSAIKIGGRRLYELARKGETIERTSRDIVISELTVSPIISQNLPSSNDWNELVLVKGDKVRLDVSCGKGTYIRTLCSDIGRSLGCGATMGFLLRTRVGNMHISDSYTLDELRELNPETLPECLISIKNMLVNLKELEVDNSLASRIRNGVVLTGNHIPPNFSEGDLYNVTNSKNSLAVYKAEQTDGGPRLKPVRVFNC